MIHEQLIGKSIRTAMDVLNELRASRHLTRATGEMMVEIDIKVLPGRRLLFAHQEFIASGDKSGRY